MKQVLHSFTFIIISILLVVNFSYAQGWERTFGGSAEDNADAIIQTADGGFALLGFIETNSSAGTNVLLIKTDEDGNLQWQHTYGAPGDDKGFDLLQEEDGSYVIVGQTSSGNGEEDVLLLKVDSRGNELWQRSYGGAYNDRGFGIAASQYGGYILTGRTEEVAEGGANVYLLRVDKEGDLIWSKTFGGDAIDVGESVLETREGEIVVVGHTKSFATADPVNPGLVSSDVYFIKTNADGTTLIEKNFGNIEQDMAFDVVETRQGHFAVTGVTSDEGNVYLLLLNASGNELWSKSYGGIFDDAGYAIAETPDGGFVITGFKAVTPTNSEVYLLRTDAVGQLLWERLFGSFGQDIGRDVVVTVDGGYAIAGNYDVNDDEDRTSLIPLYDSYLIKANEQGNVFKNVIRGNVFRDLNTNCDRESNEQPLEDWLVRISSGSEEFYATTDPQGNFEVSVRNGSYNVGLVVLNNAWETCQNYNLVFAESDTVNLDFAARAAIEDCPVVVADVSSPYLEPCRSTDYVVSLCNRGVSKAKDTYVEVKFDQYLTVNYSTLPWTSHDNNIYRFDIGDLNIEECTSFRVNVTLDCGVQPGQGHCVEAYAYPDDFCIPLPPLYNDASIRVSGECVGDSVQFVLTNVGSGDMLTPQQFVIIQDILITRQFSGEYQLPSGASDTIRIGASSATSRIIVNQPDGHPFSDNASAAVEGCPNGQPFNTGLLTAFGDADDLPFYSVDCQVNKMVTGRADLTPSPAGVGAERLISQKDAIEYHLFFQNTGTDTVNQIVIRDTLSSMLDITTLQMGAASHAYDFQISGTGILKITFKNINLPNGADAASNSFGFVKFRIDQKEGNSVGTLIDNQAFVTFDYGVPFASNVTTLTVGGEEVEEYLDATTSINIIDNPQLEVKIQPNPFAATSGTHILIKGIEENAAMTFELFDLAGKSVYQERFRGSQYQLVPNSLNGGLYIYQLRANNQLVNTGKLVIK